MRPTAARAPTWAAALTTAVLLLLVMASGTLAAATPMRWHRLNVHSDPPEHERFSCVADDLWRCRYDKLPEPILGLSWDSTHGTFSGTDTTATFQCPDWFPGAACDAADQVISGLATFVQPRGSGSFSVSQQLLVSSDGTLWIYWGDAFQFVCPWYPTFEETLTAENACTFAP